MTETLSAAVPTTGAAALLPAAMYLVGAVAWLAIVFGTRFRQIRGTTLVAPWVWGAISVTTVGAVETFLALDGTNAAAWAPALRYAAAMSTFCPIVALLGAKRPQNVGWQWIVLSLWAILCQPSIEWLLFGGVAEIHPARFWFLMILVFVGATNGLGTRNWLASVFFSCGQILLLLPYFSAQPVIAADRAAACGLLSLFLWGVCLLLTDRRSSGVAIRSDANRLDRVWLDFRDAFGVVWSLRILERMNASATMYDWPVTLTWHGFEPRASATHVDTPSLVEESFRTLLRRFVSPEWIEARLPAQAALVELASAAAASD
jgi:hypothetical protein